MPPPQNAMPETGLDYFGARYFSGAMGRFTSPDEPLVDQWETNPQSWNLYAYGRNNPLRYTDPTGNCSQAAGGYTDEGSGLFPGPCSGQEISPGAQQVNVTGKAGNAAVALAVNTLIALDNAANDFFSPLVNAMGVRPSYMQNTPTNREFTGQVATAGAFVGTMLLGPGGEASAAPREIKVTWKGLLHVIQRHTGGMAGKSFFGDSAAVTGLVKAAEAVAPTPQAGGNFIRIVDAGRTIGTDVTTGQATSVYTVVTNKAGELVTAFPGKPTR